MSQVAAEKWEFSLLVDRANRILDSRGQSELYLAAPAKRLIGGHLVSFFDETERLGFLRYMARLTVRGEAEPVSANLRSTAMGIKRFSMAAKKADGRSWWILFSQEERAEAERLDAGENEFATADEFTYLVDARAPGKPMDITVFRARALSEGTADLTTEQQAALDESLGRSLIAHAHEHMVARPAVGEYALMHAEDKPIAEIERDLVNVAAQHNLTDLELVSEMRHLDGTVAATQVISEMRQKLQARSVESGIQHAMPVAARRPIWIPAAGLGLACILAIAGWVAFH